MSDPNLFSLDVEWNADDPAGYNVGTKRVGPLVGATQLGMSVYELPPGNSVCPYHYEVGMEEWACQPLQRWPAVRVERCSASSPVRRAAAEEQLEIWAGRANADFVGSDRGGDPAAVAFDEFLYGRPVAPELLEADEVPAEPSEGEWPADQRRDDAVAPSA